jgi:hypothetical protein
MFVDIRIAVIDVGAALDDKVEPGSYVRRCCGAVFEE